MEPSTEQSTQQSMNDTHTLPAPGATIVRWTAKTKMEWEQWFLPSPAGAQFEKVPLCLTCGKAYSETHRAWVGHPFCTEECLKLFRVKTTVGAACVQLFQMERGVCRLCALNCDALLRSLENEPSVLERVAILEATKRFSNKRAHAVAVSLKAGDLWQADHHVPVAEDGGACDLGNLRTLCDGCHRDVTKDLRGRLRDAANETAAVGTRDIRGLFGR